MDTAGRMARVFACGEALGGSVGVSLEPRGQVELMKGQSTPRWVVVSMCLSAYM